MVIRDLPKVSEVEQLVSLFDGWLLHPQEREEFLRLATSPKNFARIMKVLERSKKLEVRS